jgi:hypothetical protein
MIIFFFFRSQNSGFESRVRPALSATHFFLCVSVTTAGLRMRHATRHYTGQDEDRTTRALPVRPFMTNFKLWDLGRNILTRADAHDELSESLEKGNWL